MRPPGLLVSMHLLVLSAFRLVLCKQNTGRDQVSMHLLVLSAFRHNLVLARERGIVRLNAPFGAQCFPTEAVKYASRSAARLNAPFGAQCFPTDEVSQWLLGWTNGLNAPFGAQCFPTPPPESRVATPFPGTKTPPTWKAPNRIGSHRSN